MAQVTVYNAARMKEIEDASIVDGEVVGDDLILTRHDQTTINAGSVRGPQGDQGVPGDMNVSDLSAIIASLSDYLFEPGDIKVTLRATPPAGEWLAFGATYTDAQTNYPDLWAVAPAALKSGSDLVLPDISEAALEADASALGVLSGSNLLSLILPNIPPHQHTVEHTHRYDHSHPVSVSTEAHAHTIGGGSHSHTVSGSTNSDAHTHTTTQDGNHSHYNNVGGLSNPPLVYQGGGGTLGIADDAYWNHIWGTPLNVGSWTPTNAGVHEHDTDSDSHSHTISGTSNSVSHSHTCTSVGHSHTATAESSAMTTDPTSAGMSGATGGFEGFATPFDGRGARLGVNVWLKT